MAIFNRTYSPLRTQLSMLVSEGSLTQDYDADNKVYTPDRRIRPTAIQPMCSIIDPSGILVNGVVNRYITDIKWYENEISEENLISASNAKFAVDSTSDTDNRGRIIVMKNVAFDAPVTLIFTATFVDMVNGKLRRKAYFVGRSVLASNVAASSPLVLKTDYPRGRCFNPIKEPDHLKLSADLVSGDTSVPAAFWWYKKNGLNESLITDYVGHNLRELRVPASSIGKEQHYVCKVQDCRQNLTDVRNTYLEEKLNKIADCPRNLLAKQYFLDLNDEIKEGVVTEGEDADGKYICIPNPSTLRTYVDGNKQRDLFSGKMSFKENTVYALRVLGKYVSDIETLWGFAFVIAYTDGSVSAALRIDYKANKKVKVVHKSTSGKTISHISCTYGHTIPVYIYDIQITEEYAYNLLEGDTEEVTIDGGTSPSKVELILIPQNLKVGGKYTMSVDDIDSTSESDRVLLYQTGSINSSVSNNIFLSRTKKVSTLTVLEKYDMNTPTYLYLYANDVGGSAGNKVTYKNVQLLEGEYAWNVLGEDVEELTVTASESQNQKSDKIEIKNKLQASGKYTIDVGEIINLKGAPESYIVLLYQSKGVNAQVSNSLDLSPSNTTGVFTLNNNYNPELATYLFFYAGKINATAGNSVQFKNIRLLQGETVLPSMPDYTPHFIPSAPDIEVESEAIQLPEGYRPAVQGKTLNHEFTLVTRLPPYRMRVVTPYGDDSGVISIPSDVKLFPARIQVDVSGIGTLDHPERYFSADWGNGLKGMNVLLDADDIGLGVQAVEPDVVEGLGYVKYAASGCSLSPANRDKVEEFVVGSRIVVEIPPNIPNASTNISLRKNGVGLLIMYNTNGDVSLAIYGYNERMSTIIKGVENVIQRYELRIGATLEECQLFLNGKLYTGTFGNIENGGGNAFFIDINSRVSLIEFYSSDNALLHKWDFEGSTDDERLSDKADTGNKLNFSKKSEGFELIPV